MSFNTHDAGLIVFNKDVPRDAVAEFMNKLKIAYACYDWIDLHMRDEGGKTALAYRVDLKAEDMNTRFHHEIIGRLFRRFGKNEYNKPKGVRLWSLSDVLESAT